MYLYDLLPVGTCACRVALKGQWICGHMGRSRLWRRFLVNCLAAAQRGHACLLYIRCFRCNEGRERSVKLVHGHLKLPSSCCWYYDTLRHGSLRVKCLEGDFAIFGLKRTNSGLCLFIPQLQGRWICRGLGSPRLRWKFFQSQFEADGRCCRVSWLED